MFYIHLKSSFLDQDAGKVNKISLSVALNCDKHTSNRHYGYLDLYFLVSPNGENIFDYLLLYFYINRLVLKRKTSSIFTSEGTESMVPPMASSL